MNVHETRSDILDKLNQLLSRNTEAEKGYQQAAENAKDAELKSLFMAQSRQRGEFAQELDREIRALGGTPDHDSSLAGDLHRAWINVKTAFTPNDDKATLEECKRGDQVALDDYSEILHDTTLMASTRELLLRQKERIMAAHSGMSRLALVV